MNISTILSRFELDLTNHIVGVTVDNCHMMQKLARQSGLLHQGCITHAIHLAFVDVFQRQEADEDEQDGLIETEADEDETEDDDFEGLDLLLDMCSGRILCLLNNLSFKILKSKYGILHQNCIAHGVHLAIGQRICLNKDKEDEEASTDYNDNDEEANFLQEIQDDIDEEVSWAIADVLHEVRAVIKAIKSFEGRHLYRQSKSGT
ncbi:hypothetical protein Ciccas_004720 [Cichlidogyrus casuarinus]|uniref:Transposase n=1 Tax=Cichlidogyrus casuarinus TaxID=1844966 RepID=A0ABD2QAN1_9PLAT